MNRDRLLCSDVGKKILTFFLARHGIDLLPSLCCLDAALPVRNASSLLRVIGSWYRHSPERNTARICRKTLNLSERFASATRTGRGNTKSQPQCILHQKCSPLNLYWSAP